MYMYAYAQSLDYGGGRCLVGVDCLAGAGFVIVVVWCRWDAEHARVGGITPISEEADDGVEVVGVERVVAN